jgi:endonuclease YncB( thermonuclease family)
MGTSARSRLWFGAAAAMTAGGLAIGVVVVAAHGDDHPAGPRDVGVVSRVIDGDTIVVDIAGRAEHVRLIGIDTPETHVDDGPPECFGPEATTYTGSLIPVGTEVRLSRDVVGRDDYGRLLAYVYRRSDRRFVNESLVLDGYARVLTIPPNDTFAARFAADAAAAAAAGLGLWGTCSG